MFELPFVLSHPLASLGLALTLTRAQIFPAVMVARETAVDGHRAALAEAFPRASVVTVDWCHPAPAEPADITILCRLPLGRAVATLAGYPPALVAILDAPDGEDDDPALTSLVAAATRALIIPLVPPCLSHLHGRGA